MAKDQTFAGQGELERLQNDPGLNARTPVLVVDVDDRVHPLEVDDHGGLNGDSAAHQARASAVRNDGHARLHRQLNDGRYFLRRPWAGDQQRMRRKRVVFWKAAPWA